MANAPVGTKPPAAHAADKAPPPAAPETIRVRVKAGRNIAVGRDQKTRMLVTYAGGAWANLSPDKFAAVREHVETEAEIAEAARKSGAPSQPQQDHTAMQNDWQEFRKREKERAAREKEFRKAQIDGLVPSQSAAGAKA